MKKYLIVIIAICVVIGGIYGIYVLYIAPKVQNHPVNNNTNQVVNYDLITDQENYKEYSFETTFENTTVENASRGALANIQSFATALSYNSKEKAIFDPREIIKGEARNKYDDIYKFGSQEYTIKPVVAGSRTFAVYNGETKLLERYMCFPNKATDDGIALLSVNNKLAVTFYECQGEEFFNNIYYDGAFINETYNVTDAAYLFSWEGQLGFVAKQQDKYFVFFKGEPISPGFDKIHTKNCCAMQDILPTLYENGVLVFYGVRAGEAMISEIKLQG